MMQNAQPAPMAAPPTGMLGAAQDAPEAQQGAEPDAGTDQNYIAAMKMAMTALYGKEAAHDVAKAIKTAKDPVEALANTAYEMVTVVDERTNGAVPDELLIQFASEVLGEVVEIATAAGIKVSGQMIAEATREMLLRYVTEQGIDPTQLREAMGKVDTAKLGAALEKEGA
ncbi:MAG: hypothetical protein RL030_1795 [Pseudomonadota bacterium]|jgi:hypothetical protein